MKWQKYDFKGVHEIYNDSKEKEGINQSIDLIYIWSFRWWLIKWQKLYDKRSSIIAKFMF